MSKSAPRAVQTPGESAVQTGGDGVDLGAAAGAAAGADKVLADAGIEVVEGSATAQILSQLKEVTQERDDLREQLAVAQAQIAQLKAGAKAAKPSTRPASLPPVAEAPYLTEKGWIVPEPKKD